MKEIEDIKLRFDSILCLCSEGIEFMNKIQLADAVIKEAKRGYETAQRLEGMLME